MKEKLVILSILIFLALAVSVVAVPPQAQVFKGDNGYGIEYPPTQTIELNQPFDFHFHIFNESNGVPIFNDTTACYFHLYDHKGNHLYTALDLPLDTDQWNFELYVNANNFTEVGLYSYVIQCNSTADNLGGFAAVPLEVTSTGREEENNDYLIIGAISLIGIIIMMFLYLGWVYSKEESFYKFLCYLFWYLALLMPLFGMRILASAAISTTFKTLINTLYRIYLNIYYALIILLAVYFLIMFLVWLINYKKPSWKKGIDDY